MSARSQRTSSHFIVYFYAEPVTDVAVIQCRRAVVIGAESLVLHAVLQGEPKK